MHSKKIMVLTALGGLLLFSGLFPLLTLLFRVEINEPGGWFTEPAVYTVFQWPKALGWSLFLALCGGGLLHAALTNRFYYPNAIGRFLDQGRFGRAWELGIRFDEFTRIESYLDENVNLATPGLRKSFHNALKHLRRLRATASDPLNRALTDSLRQYAAGHAEKGLAVLGEIVERLVLLQRQGIDPRKVGDRLDRIQANIDQLAEATEAARIQLANLSLGAEPDNMASEAGALMRQVSLVAEELHQFDNRMASWESSPNPHAG